MMKTITITVHDRPQYLVRILETLVKNNLNGWHIVVGLEPTPRKSEQLELIQKYIPQAEIIHNETKLGVCENPFSLLTYVFKELKSEINLYLEEDLIVSPDICQLAEWYSHLEDDSLCLALCNVGRMEVDDINNNKPESCLFYANKKMTLSGGGNGFSALGLVIKRNQWKNFQDNWHNSSSGWDCNITEVANRKRVLTPYKTRSDHIGDWGVHVKGRRQNRKLRLGILNVNQEVVDPQSYWIFVHPDNL